MYFKKYGWLGTALFTFSDSIVAHPSHGDPHVGHVHAFWEMNEALVLAVVTMGVGAVLWRSFCHFRNANNKDDGQ
jgi:hypothetical protein